MKSTVELWHDKQRSWQQESALEAVSVDGLLIRAQCSLISEGTERLVISGAISERLAEEMAVPHMKGSLSSRFTYGYSMVGEVLDGPPSITGKLVHLMHPHQSIATASVDDICIVPAEVDPTTATLASNMETAVNAMWDARPDPGDRILIVGYGTVGALISSICCNTAGLEVYVLEKDETRRKMAHAQGCAVWEAAQTADFDIVFNTSGTTDTLQLALEATRTEGKVLDLNWYGEAEVPLSLGSDFHYGRKRIISSQVGRIPDRKAAHWDYRRRKDLVFQLLADLNPRWIIDREVPWSQAPAYYEELRAGKRNGLGTIINYEQ